MQPKYAIENNIVVYTLKELNILGKMGRLSRSLFDIVKEGITSQDNAEFSPVRNMMIGPLTLEVLAAFNFNPSIDFTMTRDETNLSSIIALSLNKDKSLEFINTMEKISGFKTINPPKSFIETIPIQMIKKGTHYLYIRNKYKCNKEKIENAFGYAHYNSFLNIYFKISKDETIQRVLRYYRI